MVALRSVISRYVWHTTKSRADLSKPRLTHRSSCSPCSSSICDNNLASRNTVAACSKVTPCSLSFLAALIGSHSNRYSNRPATAPLSHEFRVPGRDLTSAMSRGAQVSQRRRRLHRDVRRHLLSAFNPLDASRAALGQQERVQPALPSSCASSIRTPPRPPPRPPRPAGARSARVHVARSSSHPGGNLVCVMIVSFVGGAPTTRGVHDREAMGARK